MPCRCPPCTDHGGLGGPSPRAISGGVLTDVAISLSTDGEWSVNGTLLSELDLRSVDRSAGIMH